jgi:hypothetical protein
MKEMFTNTVCNVGEGQSFVSAQLEKQCCLPLNVKIVIFAYDIRNSMNNVRISLKFLAGRITSMFRLLCLIIKRSCLENVKQCHNLMFLTVFK